MRSVCVAILLLLFALTAADAAAIDVRRLEGGSTLVVIEGKLEIGDIETFRAKVAPLPAAGTTVAFRSKGGRLLAGIRIGTLIRSKKFATAVPDAAECASACALAWLGGTRRFVGKDARIGFHAAYIIREGAPTESGPGNAIVGAYLNQLGLSEKAILYVTQAVPTSMQWMSMQDAAEAGIAVAPLLPPSASTAAASADYPEGSPERLAIDFVLALFTRWSGPNAELLPFLDKSYAEKVLYFGKSTSRQAVLRDKRRLAERWNQRAYTVRPGSLSATCAGADGMCRVKGLMSWKFNSPERKESPRGVTSFEYSFINVIDEHRPLQIAAETTSAQDKRPPASNPLALVGRGLQKLVSQLRTPSKSANAGIRPKAPIVR